MEIYDAHMHVNLAVEDEFCRYLEKICGGNIIVNSQDELDVILRYPNVFYSEKKMNLIVYWFNGFQKQSEEWKEKLGIQKVGVKLHPRMRGYVIEDIGWIVKELEKVKFDYIVIDAFDVGSKIDNFISLQLIIELAKAYSNKKIIVAHAGGYRCLEYLMVLKNIKNVFYDISYTVNYLRYSSVAMDIQHLLYVRKEKVLFGTDFPEYDLEETLNNFISLVDKMEDKEEIKRLVLFENYKNNF